MIKKKRYWLFIASCILMFFTNIGYSEVWGDSDDIVDHIGVSNSNNEQESAYVSERTRLANERIQSLRVETNNRADKNDVSLPERPSSNSESQRVASMLSDAENEYNKILQYMMEEVLHQRKYFVDEPSKEQGRISGNYHLSYKGSSILGANEKIDIALERYKYLRAMEAFNKGNIKEFLGNEDGKNLKGQDRQDYLKRQQASMSDQYDGVRSVARNEDGSRNTKNLTSTINDKISRYGNSGINEFSLDLKGAAESDFGIEGWLKGDDETLSCKALLCLTGGGTDKECQSAIAAYLARTFVPKKPHKTVTNRKNFLKLCPTDDSRRGNKASIAGSNSKPYSGATGFNSLIELIGDGVGECTVDRHGQEAGNKYGVSSYNQRMRTIRFNWADPTSKKEPSNPAFFYEMEVIDDILDPKCAKYVTHEYVDIYKTPLFKRVPSKEINSNHDWLSPEGIKYLSRSYDEDRDDLNSFLGDYKDSVTRYLLAIAEKSQLYTVRNWFSEVSRNNSWQQAHKNGQVIVIPQNLEAVYDFNSKRMYYFGYWYHQSPIDFDHFTPSEKAIQDVKDYKPEAPENAGYIDQMIDGYNDYDSNTILDSSAPNDPNSDRYEYKDSDDGEDDDVE